MTDHYETQEAPARHANGQFGPGNPGRPKGSRNGSSQRALRAILDDFECNRDEFLTNLREEFPIEYVRMIAKVLPRPVAAEATPAVEEWSAEELSRAHAEVRRLINIETDPRAAMVGIEAILNRSS